MRHESNLHQLCHVVDKNHHTNNLAAKGDVAFFFLGLMLSLFLPGSMWVPLQEKKARQ